MGSEAADAPVRVIRSPRRTRTLQARMVDGVLEVRIPASFSATQEREAVEEMTARVRRKSTSSARSDGELRERADRLNREVLDGRGRVGSIRWVGNQNTRWGSCSVATGDIRISDRLKDAPDYVLDTVIVHEVTHTFIAGHTAEFWRWADRAPRAERAKGYLEALQRFGARGAAGA